MVYTTRKNQATRGNRWTRADYEIEASITICYLLLNIFLAEREDGFCCIPIKSDFNYNGPWVQRLLCTSVLQKKYSCHVIMLEFIVLLEVGTMETEIILCIRK